MKKFGEFLKSTLKSGMLALFPLLASLYVIVLVFGYLAGFIKPLVERFIPESDRFCVTFVNAASILLLLGLCFVLGLVNRTQIGKTLSDHANRILRVIPGYGVWNRIARIVFDTEDASGTPVVVQREDSRQVGFRMGEIGTDEMAVFFPDAGSLRSGAVEIVKASAVERLDLPPMRVAKVIESYGVGMQALFADADRDKDPH